MKKISLLSLAIILAITTMVAQEVEYYGIWTNNPDIQNKWGIDDVNRHMYVWDSTLGDSGVEPAVPYGDPLGFTGLNPDWWGFGLWDDAGPDLSAFADGYLVFYIKSNHTQNIEITISDNTSAENGKMWELTAADFARDSEWHQVALPISEAVTAGVDLSIMGHVFSSSGGGRPGLIAFDDIYYVSDFAPTSLRDKGMAAPVSIFPNPASSAFNIQLGGEVECVSVFGILGTTVFSETGLSGVSSKRVNTSEWAKGLYLVEVTDIRGLKRISKLSVK